MKSSVHKHVHCHQTTKSCANDKKDCTETISTKKLWRTLFNDLSLHIEHALDLTAPHTHKAHLGYERRVEVVPCTDLVGRSHRDQECYIMLT